MIVDVQKVEGILRDVSNSIILPKFGHLAPNEISTKSSPSDLVTATDIAAEEELKRRLMPLFPGAGFIGEESAAADPTLMKGLDRKGAYWVVDPIDGTRNFVRERPEFGTIVAFILDGVVEHGFIFAAPDNKCAIASRGEGVFWGGHRITPSSSRNGEVQGLRSMGWLLPPYKDRLVTSLKKNFSTEPAHCSAYGYIALAKGQYDFALYSRIHPWDHLAGSLLLNELGGRLAFVDDRTPYTPQGSVDRPMLVAAPGRNWQSIADTLLTN